MITIDLMNHSSFTIHFRQTTAIAVAMLFFGAEGPGQSNTDIARWQTIIETSTFKEISNPKEIDKRLLSKFPDWKTMTRRAGRFNSSDVGGGPRRKVYFIAKSGNNWIISYEQGGKAYHPHCFLITINKQNNSIFDNNCLKIESFDLLKRLLKNQDCPFTQWRESEY
jgi:hypothetical protein